MHDGDILIVGLGSAGQRHLANLRTLGWPGIRLCRTGLSTLPVDHLAAYPSHDDLEDALRHRPLAVIVSNPTALHMPVALAAARAGAHLLIEKPLSHTLDGTAELEATVAAHRRQALVGFQFRFHPAFARMKVWIDEGAIGEVVLARARWCEYLPDMHPWEDFRAGYAAREDLGGGVLSTFCHPFDYLRWMVGDADVCDAAAGPPDDLRLEVDTNVDVTLQFRNGASGHVHLDFVQRPPEHRLTIVGTAGSISWSQDDHIARLHRASGARGDTAAPPDGFERNTMFLDQMRHFLACVRNHDTPRCTLHDGRETLRLVLAARRALTTVPL